MRTDPRWTGTCIADLRSRVSGAQSVADIASALQRRTDDVLGMMKRLRLREAGPAET